MTTLKEALDEFVLAGKADGLSDKTIKWYSSLLSAFVSAHEGRSIASITAHELRQYIAALRDNTVLFKDAPQRPELEQHYSPSTINGHITALKRFFTWCADEYELPNTMARVGKRQKIKPVPRAISESDFVKLFDNAEKMRDKALLAVFADTGARLSGVLSMSLSELDLEKRQANILEKGKKAHKVYFTHFTAQLLRVWIKERGKLKNDALWTSFNDTNPLTVSGIHEMLKRLKKKARVTGRVNPHSFRHRFARMYIESGGSISTLARLLGHADIQTTHQYYAVFSEDELQAMHDKHIGGWNE